MRKRIRRIMWLAMLIINSAGAGWAAYEIAATAARGNKWMLLLGLPVSLIYGMTAANMMELKREWGI